MTQDPIKQSQGEADLGAVVPDWSPRPWPAREVFAGQYVRMEPLSPRHAGELYAAFSEDQAGKIWTYLPYGPFESLTAFEDWMVATAFGKDPQFYAFVVARKACGLAALMRTNQDHGVIEVGHINLAPKLQRTRAATEGLYLLIDHAMTDLGYRRFEWKCNALNQASRQAALRYGFTFEGSFRQSNVFKGRNRDTAWFSILDTEWPVCRAGFNTWLDPENFDPNGRQRKSLRLCRDGV